MPADPHILVETFGKHMWDLRPKPTAHHIEQSLFILKDLCTCSHVLRADAVKSSLQPPYTEPYEVLTRWWFLMWHQSCGKQSRSQRKDLKPAYTAREDLY
jgi:hypothetical protein